MQEFVAFAVVLSISCKCVAFLMMQVEGFWDDSSTADTWNSIRNTDSEVVEKDPGTGDCILTPPVALSSDSGQTIQQLQAESDVVLLTNDPFLQPTPVPEVESEDAVQGDEIGSPLADVVDKHEQALDVAMEPMEAAAFLETELAGPSIEQEESQPETGAILLAVGVLSTLALVAVIGADGQLQLGL